MSDDGGSSAGRPVAGELEGLNRRVTLLLDATLSLTEHHDVELPRVLERIVQLARDVAGARYALIGVYDRDGAMQTFVHCGVDADVVARIGHLPEGKGLLREAVVAEGPVRLEDLTADPRSVGFPAHHPPMRTLLGVAVASSWRRYGNLYLTERLDGRPFDEQDERFVAALAAFAGAAIENSLLIAAERERSTTAAELAATRERERLHAEMLARVIEAQEAERARVSRDLHDEIGQALTSVLLALRLVEGSLGAPEPAVGDALRRTVEVRDLAADALRQVRALAFELRPTVLDDLGLAAALERLVSEVSARHGPPIDLAVDGLDPDRRLPPDIETVVYRVVQEALSNVTRHAGARSASVVVTVGADRLRAIVEDDGVGFDPAGVPPASLGLHGMAERAALVGGTLELDGAPGSGATVRLEVPIG